MFTNKNYGKVVAAILLAFTMIGCGGGSNESKEMKELSKDGKIKCGFISRVDTLKHVAYYEFSVGNDIYTGHFEYTDKNIAQKDALVEVVYLPKNPNVNRRLDW